MNKYMSKLHVTLLNGTIRTIQAPKEMLFELESSFVIAIVNIGVANIINILRKSTPVLMEWLCY